MDFNLHSDKITLHGRSLIYNGKINMDWVGAGFSLEFIGSSIRVFFETEADKSREDVPPIYVYSELDGVPQKTAVSNSKEVLVIDGLEKGKHCFKLLRVTEVYSPACSPITDVKDYLFVTDIEIGEAEEGELCSADKREKMIIDFYGDSITNGWASLARPDNEQRRECDNDYTVSYAYLVSKALDAEARICAFSGRGIVACCHGNRAEPMKMFYPMASRSLPTKFDFTDKPDIAVIALGTNDCGGGVERDEFKEAAREFIKMVRKDAPDAKIIWMYGMMNERFVPVLYDLIEEMRIGDRKISFLPIEAVKKEKNEIGAFGHPNRIGQKRIAEELLKHIQKEWY